MQLTREADYAIRIMLEVGGHAGDVPTTTAEIARRRLVPRPFVRKIVRGLVATSLLRSRRGARGGLLLARPAGEIPLLKIVEAAQGPISVNTCVLEPDLCPFQRTCPVYDVCNLARTQLVQLLGGVSLADLVEAGAKLKAKPRRPAEEATAALVATA